MTHYLTEKLEQSVNSFNKLVLTFRPNVTGGDYCVATINDSEIADLYEDLRSDYPESATPQKDLQIVINYCVENGRFYHENGEEIDEYEFSNNNEY